MDREMKIFLKLERYFGFHMTPTTEQPNGRCVWGLRLRSRALGSCFAEKLVRRFVPPICWDFFADLGGGWLLPDPSEIHGLPLSPAPPSKGLFSVVGSRKRFYFSAAVRKRLG